VKIVHEQDGDVEVIKPRGPLVAEDSEQLRRQVNKAMEEHGGAVILDMSGVPFVDSQGLEALMDLTEHLIRTGQALKVCGLNETLCEVLEITELAALFEQFDDVASAVGSLR